MASSVIVFVVASILFFTAGFLCGHFCKNKGKQSAAGGGTAHVPPAGGRMQIPYYDDVVLKQEVELKENVHGLWSIAIIIIIINIILYSNDIAHNSTLL